MQEAHTVLAGQPTLGLNALLLSLDASYRNAGLSRYISNLMAHLPAALPDWNCLAYVSRPGIDIPGWHVRQASWNTAKPMRRILWEQLALPLAERRDRIDLLHAAVNVGPIAGRCPIVVTIHDLAFVRFPELFPRANRAYLQYMASRTARRSAAVIVDSASTGRDVVELLGVPESRVHVIYPGLNAGLCPAPSEERLSAFRRRQHLPDEYVLFVGTLEPRKNIATLLEAWSILVRRDPECPPLVIAGGKGWFYEELEDRARALGLEDSVRFAGFIPDDDLAGWYAAATLFVFPSLYEGFGFPPLEAMSQGVPVIVSDRSSLPEVVGDAGLHLPPEEPALWAESIAGLLASPERRRSMRAAGLAQAARFTWEETARRTAEVYRQVLSHG
ncbi:MAG: glycosyltransferase family 4 protein [Chloroflexi bacterium]|nr:glycosyltransferase family 4 protein [Chloroflexota bacterium]